MACVTGSHSFVSSVLKLLILSVILSRVAKLLSHSTYSTFTGLAELVKEVDYSCVDVAESPPRQVHRPLR